MPRWRGLRAGSPAAYLPLGAAHAVGGGGATDPGEVTLYTYNLKIKIKIGLLGMIMMTKT